MKKKLVIMTLTAIMAFSGVQATAFAAAPDNTKIESQVEVKEAFHEETDGLRSEEHSGMKLDEVKEGKLGTFTENTYPTYVYEAMGIRVETHIIWKDEFWIPNGSGGVTKTDMDGADKYLSDHFTITSYWDGDDCYHCKFWDKNSGVLVYQHDDPKPHW